MKTTSLQTTAHRAFSTTATVLRPFVALALIASLSGIRAHAEDSAEPAGITIVTSRSTLTLSPVGGLTSENSQRQAGRIAEIALGELITDAAALDGEEAILLGEIGAYKAKEQEEKAVVDAAATAYEADNAAHAQKLAAHNAILAPLQAEIAASNALPADQRDPGTVSALNARKDVSDAQAAVLNDEVKRLQWQRAEVVVMGEEADERLKAIRVELEPRIATLKAKLGLAYRQLKQCAEYAESIRGIMPQKFDPTNPETVVLDGAMEQLKSWGARGYDGN